MADLDNPDTTPDRYGMSIGVVVARKDPKRLGRVRVRVPGLFEPASSWAYPLGMAGGGTTDEGTWWIPQMGSEVAIWLNRGDEDHPYYMPAQWGTGEPPEASDGGDPDVVVMSMGGAYQLIVDRRKATKGFKIVDKASNDNILEFDGVTRQVQLSAVTGIQLLTTGQIDLKALLITINGVPVNLGKV